MNVEYYKTVWGFDPNTERKETRGHLAGQISYYEQFYKLKDFRNIAIGARTSWSHVNNFPYNNIIFKRIKELHHPDPVIEMALNLKKMRLSNHEITRRVVDAFKLKNYQKVRKTVTDVNLSRVTRGLNREEVVSCVHTAIYNTTISKFSEDDAISTENKGKIYLTPEEHFLALRSYVAAVAEIGIRDMVFSSYFSESNNPITLPFGFNDMMQRQVLTALHSLAPSETDLLTADLLAYIMDSIPREWLAKNWNALESTYHFCQLLTSGNMTPEILYWMNLGGRSL